MSRPGSPSKNAAPPSPLSTEVHDTVPVPDLGAAAVEVLGQNASLFQTPVHVQAFPSKSPVRTRENWDKIETRDGIKSRGTTQSLPRSPGPSLLTQALASARGIQQTDHQKESNDDTATTYSSNDNDNDNRSSSNDTSATSAVPDNYYFDDRDSPVKAEWKGHRLHLVREKESANPSSDAQVRSKRVKNAEQQTSIDRAAASRASVMAAPAMIPMTSTALSHRDSMAYARDIFKEHHGSLDRSRDRASTSLDIDRPTASSLKSRALSLSASPENPTHLKSSFATASSGAVTDDSINDPFRDTQPSTVHQPTAAQPIPIGSEKTEKIWSIGSGDTEEEDGLVEKSVTEAMAGVEPNGRSRKSSYSLRFFKEGLPSDGRSRRKDNKSTTRDKLAPTHEEPQGQDSPISSLTPVSVTRQHASKSTHEDDQTPRTFEIDSDRSHAVTAGDTSHAIPSTQVEQTDHGTSIVSTLLLSQVGPGPLSEFGLAEGQRRPADESHICDEPIAADVGGARDDQQHHRRRHDTVVDTAVANVRDNTAVDTDPEDSGEEKISSAVFLPHQEVPEARPAHTDPANSSQIQRPRSVSHSSSHPWLVKADEPEPEREPFAEDENVSPVLQPTQSHVRELPVSRDNQPLRQDKAEDAVIADEYDVKRHLESKSRVSVTPYEDHVHQHQHHARQPLEAIDLIPYKHQVGGHTTLWRFSRRAVCKQLNNRENEFYETIERYHRDLLPFLPRYIGVLNVTFQKQSRRKSTLKRDEHSIFGSKKFSGDARDNSNSANGAEYDVNEAITTDSAEPTASRLVSQSLANSTVRVPTVTFNDNKHILPRNLLQPTPPPEFFRRHSAFASRSHEVDSKSELGRPQLDERPNSWGATTINKRLRNEVFNDAFLKQPVEVQKHRRPHQRAVPRPILQRLLRPISSDPNLTGMDDQESVLAEAATMIGAPSQRPRHHTDTLRDVGHDASLVPDRAINPPNDRASNTKDVTGTSAPEPEILKATLTMGRRRRRYSAGGLRRRPQDVRESRGNLKYFEEADDATDYKNNHEEAPAKSSNGAVENSSAGTIAEPLSTQGLDGALFLPMDEIQYPATALKPSDLPSPLSEFEKIPRPINPKEAKTQRDRVEYFLLMEDLTAGMKRPCMMDLKMGTRQYGLDATPKKQKSQQEKCQTTTSAELGVRICGLQVWNVKTQSYEFQDKYFGRRVKAGPEFQAALQKFLYDGLDLSSILRHIPVVLRKLAQLEQIVRELAGYRFYAASLLMFYDGDNSEDGGYETIYDSTTDAATDTEDNTRRRRRNLREIDFKMADFANSFTPLDNISNKACPIQHPEEPDCGFLKGLRSLRQYFLQIQADVREELDLIPRRTRMSQQRASAYEDDVQSGFGNSLDCESLSL